MTRDGLVVELVAAGVQKKWWPVSLAGGSRLRGLDICRKLTLSVTTPSSLWASGVEPGWCEVSTLGLGCSARVAGALRGTAWVGRGGNSLSRCGWWFACWVRWRWRAGT